METYGKIKILLIKVLCYTFLNNCIQASGLKLLHVTVPSSCSPGEVVELQCDYELGNESLYAIKWYKDHEEFYRFVPNAPIKAISFKVYGIDVDISLSDSKKVVLKNVIPQSGGIFTCEVSAEAPSFTVVQGEARMEVISSTAVSDRLKMISVIIPQHISSGEKAELICDYNMGIEVLYSVKWYKDHKEFFRFVPNAHPQAISFKVYGIDVDISLSDSKKVVLKNVTPQSGGIFTCEVSAEAPSFTVVQGEAQMEVISSTAVSDRLKMISVIIPHHISSGEKAELICDYNMGIEVLYSVKWYKDHKEFFRFVPNAHPQAINFKVEGIDVDISLSDSKKVVLKNVTPQSGGIYTCEVSAEAPSFTVVQGEARMEVISSTAVSDRLKLISVIVPQRISSGEKAELICDYYMGIQVLYSVKWYKDGYEFYRFVPIAQPQVKVFKTKGINVDMSLSNNKKVILNNINLNTSGVYTCEVTSDAPLFSSVQGEAHMEVI